MDNIENLKVKENGNEFVFPLTDGIRFANEGLTKREYIATSILAGMFVGYNNGYPDKEIICKATIEFTDELLKQLSE